MRHAFLFWMLLAVFGFLAACESDDAGETDDDAAPMDDDASPDDDDNDDNDNDNDDNNDDTAPDGPGTKYPIVLMHGFFGWGYAGPFSYFAGVQDDLRAQGYDVYEPAVSPINSMEVRSAQWVAAINEHYGHRKINVIAHSQGGLDIRYMISTLGWGDRVGAVVTVSTPHYGTAIADLIVGVTPGIGEELLDWIMNMFGLDWDGIYQLSHEYVENEFNPANPDDPRVAYFSSATDAEDNCFFLLEPTHWLIGLLDGPNDGVVPVASARWGTKLGVRSADHWSIIGQPVGFANFAHLAFYRQIAAGLKAQGF
jgi:triacylglycerol lipase